MENGENPACVAALQNFSASRFTEGGDICEFSTVLNATDIYFYSNCTCDAFTPVSATVGGTTCTVQGYQFDIANGPAFEPDYPTSSPYVRL